MGREVGREGVDKRAALRKSVHWPEPWWWWAIKSPPPPAPPDEGHPKAAEASADGAGKGLSNEVTEDGRGEMGRPKRRLGSMGSNEGLNWLKEAERRECSESERSRGLGGWREDVPWRKSRLLAQELWEPLRRRVPIGSRPGGSFLGNVCDSEGGSWPRAGPPSNSIVLPR